MTNFPISSSVTTFISTWFTPKLLTKSSVVTLIASAALFAYRKEGVSLAGRISFSILPSWLYIRFKSLVASFLPKSSPSVSSLSNLYPKLASVEATSLLSPPDIQLNRTNLTQELGLQDEYIVANEYISYLHKHSWIDACKDKAMHPYLIRETSYYLNSDKTPLFIKTARIPLNPDDTINCDALSKMILQHLEKNYKTHSQIEYMQFVKLILFKLYDENKISKDAVQNISINCDETIKHEIKKKYRQIAELDKKLNTGNIKQDYFNPNRSIILSEKTQKLKQIYNMVDTLSRKKGVVFQATRNKLHPLIFYYVTNLPLKPPLWLCDADYLVWYYLIAKKIAQGKLSTLTRTRMEEHLFNHRLTAAHQLQAFAKRMLQKLKKNWDDSQVFVPEFYHMTKNSEAFNTLAVTGVALECNVANKKWQSGAFASSYPEIFSYGSYGIAMGRKLLFSSDSPFVLQRRQGTPCRKWLAFERGANDGDFFPFFDKTSALAPPEKELNARDEGLALALLSFIRSIHQPDKRPHFWRCTYAWNCQSANVFITELQKNIRVTQVHDYRTLLVYENRTDLDFFLTIKPDQLDTISKPTSFKRYNATETLAQNLIF